LPQRDALERWLTQHMYAGHSMTVGGLVLTPYSIIQTAPVPTDWRLRDAIVLRQAGLQVADARIWVDLEWVSDVSLDTNYTVFVHVFDERGELVAQIDRPPVLGTQPTSTWLPNAPTQDRYFLSLGPNPHTCLAVSVGLYEPQTGRRLPVTTAQPATVSNDAVWLKRCE